MKTNLPIPSLVIAFSVCTTRLIAQDNLNSGGAVDLDLAKKRAAEELVGQSEIARRIEGATVQKLQAEQRFEDQAQHLQDPRATEQQRLSEEYKRANGFQDRLRSVIQRANTPTVGRSLVIRSSDLDPKDQANLEEDIMVMSHVLEKSLGGALGPQTKGNSVLGIDIFFGPGSNPIRGLYLEGYGALFTLKVGFPLVPSAKAGDEKEKPQADSVWDEARQEVYGQQTDGNRVYVRGEEYDERKVNRLKDAVLDSLKNASHIRGLKGDDSVTVCVSGGQSVFVKDSGEHIRQELMDLQKQLSELRSQYTDTYPAVMNLRNQIHALESQLASKQPRSTILTVRVKKSDVDAFAKDKLGLEEFRKKAKVVSYAGAPEPADGVAVFGGGGTGGGGFGGGGSARF